jgi:hypothetical protein
MIVSIEHVMAHMHCREARLTRGEASNDRSSSWCSLEGVSVAGMLCLEKWV